MNGSNKITLWFIVGFLVLVTIAVIVVGIVSGTSSGSGNSTSTPAGFVATTVPPLTSADWVEGDTTSSVSVIEYGDFQCPACGAYFPIMQQLLSAYGNRVAFAFRNFPLYTLHPDAGMAAQAAEAAGLQGKYWPMHDLLYQNQATWSNAFPADVVSQYFDGYATSLGLNVTQFNTDVSSTAVLNKIATDVASGNAAQVDHTPTFFVNLVQIPNPASYAAFASVIDAALASSTAGIGSPAIVTITTSTASSTP